MPTCLQTKIAEQQQQCEQFTFTFNTDPENTGSIVSLDNEQNSSSPRRSYRDAVVPSNVEETPEGGNSDTLSDTRDNGMCAPSTSTLSAMTPLPASIVDDDNGNPWTVVKHRRSRSPLQGEAEKAGPKNVNNKKSKPLSVVQKGVIKEAEKALTLKEKEHLARCCKAIKPHQEDTPSSDGEAMPNEAGPIAEPSQTPGAAEPETPKWKGKGTNAPEAPKRKHKATSPPESSSEDEDEPCKDKGKGPDPRNWGNTNLNQMKQH
ncbi:hypothetical protein BDQ17DRAFT_1436948 [Cyathus striatus]|nr:hypothetical protein BDQ17DRAFT_1436948 [Cyathus striatus]